MKTLKFFGLVLVLLSMVGCSTNYRMTTHVHRDGTVEREVYAFGDSAFMAGNASRNPFLFSIDSGWTVMRLDSTLKCEFFGTQEKLNVKVTRSLSSTKNGLDFFSTTKEWARPLVMPQEKLDKRFRWFYTYYTYTCKYHEIVNKGPVPMDSYLNKQEQKLLFQGDLSTCQGLNGIELDDRLNGLEDKFQQWFYKTQFELYYDVIYHFSELSGDTIYLSRMTTDKQAVFSLMNSKQSDLDCSISSVANLLDRYYHTNYFSVLSQENNAGMESMLQEKYNEINLFGDVIKYELIMPGKLISANTSLRSKEAIIWKIDAYRLLPSDYTLTAESRTVNIWAFIITGLLVLFSVYCMIKKKNV